MLQAERSKLLIVNEWHLGAYDIACLAPFEPKSWLDDESPDLQGRQSGHAHVSNHSM